MELADIAEYSHAFYFVTFLWTFLEGETFVIFAGVAASKDILRIDLLLATAWLGSFCGDQFYFYLGRRYGKSLLRRYPHLERKIQKPLAWLEKYSVLFILTYRFLYGVRNFSSFAMGMSPLPWVQFAVLNFFGAGIWALCFSLSGYFLGDLVAKAFAENIKGASLVVLATFITVLVIEALVRARRRAAERQAEAQAQAAPPLDPTAGG